MRITLSIIGQKFEHWSITKKTPCMSFAVGFIKDIGLALTMGGIHRSMVAPKQFKMSRYGSCIISEVCMWIHHM